MFKQHAAQISKFEEIFYIEVYFIDNGIIRRVSRPNGPIIPLICYERLRDILPIVAEFSAPDDELMPTLID